MKKNICIEGIKGTGKSTLVEQVVTDKSILKGGVSVFGITKPITVPDLLEEAHAKLTALRSDDLFLERLFIRRAVFNQLKVDKRAEMIIGDRSVITAYVTRWNKWGDPWYTVKRVSGQYKNIIQPDVIIWLNLKADEAIKHIVKRNKIRLRPDDETITLLESASDTYEELLKGRIYSKIIGKCEVVELKCKGDFEGLNEEIKNIIKYYKQK